MAQLGSFGEAQQFLEDRSPINAGYGYSMTCVIILYIYIYIYMLVYDYCDDMCVCMSYHIQFNMFVYMYHMIYDI